MKRDKKIKIEEGQNIIDFLIQTEGDVDNLINFLQMNEMNYNDFPYKEYLKVNENLYDRNIFTIRNWKVKTQLTGVEEIVYRKGSFNKDYNISFDNQNELVEPPTEITYWEPFEGEVPPFNPV